MDGLTRGVTMPGMQIIPLPPECFDYKFVIANDHYYAGILNQLASVGWIPVHQSATTTLFLVTLRRPKPEFKDMFIVEKADG